MRALRLIVFAYALALALGTPALLLAAEGDPSPAVEPAAPADPAAPPAAPASEELVPIEAVNQPPSASFAIQPDLDPAEDAVAVAQGETVTLDASGSSDAEGALARFEWDLDGDGTFETDAGPGAVLTHAFPVPGTFDVRLRVTDAGGAASEASKSFTVAAPLAAEPAAVPAAEPSAPTEPSAAPAAPRSRTSKARRGRGGEDAPSARPAASASVSIVDFRFSPRTVSVNVGDTVTWTNNGDEVHTATASDGSFDTGNLRRGQSGSHTFTKAGTFSYICTPHPFMKGTVRVGGGGGSGGDDAGAAGTDDSAAGTAGDGSGGGGGGLAKTGADVLPLMGLGTLMLLMGAALGRRLPDSRP